MLSSQIKSWKPMHVVHLHKRVQVGFVEKIGEGSEKVNVRIWTNVCAIRVNRFANHYVTL